MARIVPKLNLNKTPQIVENNSLIFAKNIKVMKDGSIVTDDGISRIDTLDQTLSTGKSIVGYISYNTCVYLFLFDGNDSYIVKYDEKNPLTLTYINSAWKYSGGRKLTTKIYGEVIINLNSDIILVITETGNDELNIPIKFINTNRCSVNDDESIYTQAPKIPVINLLYDKKYTKTIPNGVYQFFIRYEIKDNFYTNWFPCSKEIYSGTQIKTDTIQGSVKYINVNSDSSESFILIVEKLTNTTFNYKSFQIGFILSHDDSTVARAWKHFSFDVEKIYFDYDTNYIEEVNIDDMLDSVYQIYNAKNITSFKNKIYISNYKESDINPNFASLASQINITLKEQLLSNTVNTYYDARLIHSHTIPVTGVVIYDYFLSNEQTDPDYITPEPGEPINVDLITQYFFKKLHKIENTFTSRTVPPYTPITGYNDEYGNWHTYTNENGGTPPAKLIEDANDRVSRLNQAYRLYNIRVTTDSGVYEFAGEGYSKSVYDSSIKSPLQALIYYISQSQNDHLRIRDYTDETRYGGFNIDGYLYNVLGEKIHSITFDFQELLYSKDGYYVSNTPRYDETLGKYVYDWSYAIAYNIDSYHYDRIIDTKYITTKVLQFDYQTLIPFKSYAFYVHYMKENGETTNGYKIKELIATTSSLAEGGKLIYPAFSNIQYPEDYPYCFISIVDTNNNVAQIFENNCIDIDALLLPVNTDIKVYSLSKLNTFISQNPTATKFNPDNVEVNALVDYNYSGKPMKDKLQYFGASGKLTVDENYPEVESIDKFFIVQNNEKNEEYLALTKCTPYLKDSEYDIYNDMNLLGFICSVCKPTATDPTDNDAGKYITGSDVYTKVLTGQVVQLNPLTTGKGIESTYDYLVYSEFNLNYLSLSAELSTRIMKVETIENDVVVGKEQYLIPSFESLTLSDVYELKSMYKTYRKKLFYPKDNDVITIFNNTIRASNVFSDEGITYVLKFEATNYYNVPTNKGYIVNLKAIADKILVHTQDSLFGFSGSSKLSTQDGNAQLSESDPFDTGITELFGSEHGFVGLANKNHTMLCYDGYFFFDKDAKTIYDYTGQGLTLLSDPIEKLLNYNELTDVVFANDYYNDRFFMTLKFKRINGLDGYDYVTLSFNYKQKTFVSLHDFTYEESFSTKTNCYFISNNRIYVVDKNATNYSGLVFNDNIFPSAVDIINQTKDAIIDVIYNENYEKVKTLNAINWIGIVVDYEFNFLTTKIDEQGNTIIEPWATGNSKERMSEALSNNKWAVDKIRVYSESTMTELCNIAYEDYLDKKPSELLNYKYPSYNNGVWTFNYLRNILDNKNTRENGKLISDEASLIYGKYFISRFVFTNSKNFKIENVIFNVQ